MSGRGFTVAFWVFPLLHPWKLTWTPPPKKKWWFPGVYVEVPCQFSGCVHSWTGLYIFLAMDHSDWLGLWEGRCGHQHSSWGWSWWCFYCQITYPKNPWTLQWRGLNLYSRGPGPQNSHFWGVRILRVKPKHNNTTNDYWLLTDATIPCEAWNHGKASPKNIV